MRRFKLPFNFIGFISLLFSVLIASNKINAQQNKKNILFIVIDGLKPSLVYDNTYIKHPNIDLLAKKGAVFYNNFCQIAECGPSRASVLTGKRPDQTQVIDDNTMLRDRKPFSLTLPQYFRENGYKTMGVGRIFDPHSVDKKHDALSWDVYISPEQLKYPQVYGPPALGFYQSAQTKKEIAKLRKEAEKNGITNKKAQFNYIVKRFKPLWEKADVQDDAYTDGAIAKTGIELMKKAAESKQAFFLAVGFERPGLPYAVPAKYWEMYDERKLPLASFSEKSAGGVKVAYHTSPELRSFQIPGYTYVMNNGLLDLPEYYRRKLVHGYYAAVTYVDALVGNILQALKAEGLSKNTLVVLWSDHGWHLGDHNLWGKSTGFEQATRTVLMILDPDMKGSIRIQSVTELVDIYPTLCDLAGLKVSEALAGKSLKPLIEKKAVQSEKYAYSETTRGKPKGSVIGYSLRNSRYRYTAWIKNKPLYAQKFNPDDLIGEELYDYKFDPHETKNYLDDASHQAILQQMRKDFSYFFNHLRTVK